MRITGNLRLEDDDGAVWEVEVHGLEVDPHMERNYVGAAVDDDVSRFGRVWRGSDRLVVHVEGRGVDPLGPVYTARFVEPERG